MDTKQATAGKEKTALAQAAAALWYGLLELLFPPKCVLCQRLLRRGEADLCEGCRKGLAEHPESTHRISFVARWHALWYYTGNVRESLLRYKFGGRRGYARFYGQQLAMLIQRRELQFDVLTWVPVSRRRRRRRGFDQVELLCAEVGRELGVSPRPLLKKVRHTPTQSGISGAAQRKANILGAYEATDPAGLAGKRVLMLDDIITTGATLSECARVLLTAGAEQVQCAALAAADRKQEKPSA